MDPSLSRVLRASALDNQGDYLDFLLSVGNNTFFDTVSDVVRGFRFNNWNRIVNNLEFLRFLLDNGVSADMRSADGNHSLLSVALEREFPDDDIVQLLLERGADPNQYDGNDFAYVANHEDREIFDLFLKHGVDLDRYKDEALLSASSFGRLDVLRFLLDARANPNVEDDLGRTPLYYALDFLEMDPENTYSKERVRLLVMYGARE